MSGLPLLKIANLSPPLRHGVQSLVSSRTRNKTVRDYLTAKGLPVISVENIHSADSVRTWLKAFPQSYYDISRGHTDSVMLFSETIFANFKDMDPSVPWSGASLANVIDSLKALAAGVQPTNSLTDLDKYASAPGVQRVFAFMLLRIILDDLHGDNADAINAPSAGAAYPSLAVRPVAFADWVVAYAKRASPYAFDLIAPEDGLTQKRKRDLKKKKDKTKKRRTHRDSSSSESSSDDSSNSGSGSDSDVEDIRRGGKTGGSRNLSSAAALLAYMKSTKLTRLGVVDCIVAITEALNDVRGVRDLAVLVEKYVLFAGRADIDIHGRAKAEMAGLQIFREVQRHLDETTVTEAALNRSLLGSLRVIYAQARRSKDVRCPEGVKVYHDLAAATKKTITNIVTFGKDATKEANLDKLRNLGSGSGYMALTPREQALKDSFASEMRELRDSFKAGTKKPLAGGRGTPKGTDRPRHPMTKLMDAIVQKKDMTRDQASKIAHNLAGTLCITCKGPRKDGNCAAACNGGKVHPDILAALAAKKL